MRPVKKKVAKTTVRKGTASKGSLSGGGRTRLDIETRRGALIALGKTIFSQSSYDAVSTEEVARLAGISKGLLYHYFPSKRQFYVETIRAVAADILQETAPPAGIPFEAVIRHSLTAFVIFVESRARLFRALVRGGIGSDTEVDAIVESIRKVTMDRVVNQWGIDRPSARLITLLYGWVGYVEAICLHWMDTGGLSREEVVEILYRGLEPAKLEIAGYS